MHKFQQSIFVCKLQDCFSLSKAKKLVLYIEKACEDKTSKKYSVPISNGEEGELLRQCGDAGKVINAKGIGKNGKIIQLGSVIVGACWSPIKIVARDGKKWKVNPSVDGVEED